MARARIRVDGGVGGGLQAFLGATMSAYSGCCERDGGIRRSKRCSRTELVRVCGDVQLAGWRVSGGRAPSGGERQRSESSEGATELGFPGPTLGQMQSEAARRAGEPSGHGKEPPPQGLGGHDLLAQTDARRPACQVVCDHLHRQPGAVGGGRVAMDSCRCLADVCGRQCHHVGGCRIRYFQKRMTQASSEMVSLNLVRFGARNRSTRCAA